jgi:ATP-dependent helicase/nuclease subunit B
MVADTRTLSRICAANVLNAKWLIAPSHRIGHQWIERLVRGGQGVANLHVTTLLGFAMSVAVEELAFRKMALAGSVAGPLVVAQACKRLPADGYFGRLEPSTSLFALIHESFSSLRLAGTTAHDIKEAHFESAAKAKDFALLLAAYEDVLHSQALVDDADVLRIAVARLQSGSSPIDREALILVPSGIRTAVLERWLLDAIPACQRIEIEHPCSPPKNDRAIGFFRAVGEVNEVREVLRRCLSQRLPLDDVEILYTHAETYVPLIYATARRFCDEADRRDGVPITVAEGIPAHMSRPGRALAGWLRWISEEYPQRLLVEMIGDGLLDCGDDERLSFSYLARLLRPIAIGLHAENYLAKLDEQIEALCRAVLPSNEDRKDDSSENEASQRRLDGLQALRKLISLLLRLSRDVESVAPVSVLDAAERFVTTVARSASELDQYAAEALIEQLRKRREWIGRLKITLDSREWLASLASQTRVLGSGPRAGRLHVAHVGSGGHSGRSHTFVVGLDDRRFPGAMLQDPILLDRERSGVNPELSTSAAQLRHRIDDMSALLSRLAGSVTLSWPSHDLADDREAFPSPVVLSAFRLLCRRGEADLPALNEAAGTPVSFAPTAPNKALDETERWLWMLSDDAANRTDRSALVESRYAHLARGRAAQIRRTEGFGPFNGLVPQAGRDLNPFAADGPVLSVSALETAGRCPLAYFFRSALKLRPIEELGVDDDRWLDAAQFGQLLHDVFRRMMNELHSAGQRPEFERDHKRLAEILSEAADRWRNDVPPPNENAVRVQYWALVRTARIFLGQEEEHCRTSEPRYFEVALGVPGVADGTALDGPDAVEANLPGGNRIRVCGKIDRVDRTENGRYCLWDYKTGGGYGYVLGDPFRQGRHLQSVLYLRMIETALRKHVDSQAVVERFGYFFPGARAHGSRISWDADRLAAGWSLIEGLCTLLADGAYPATNNADDCQWCDYRAVCRDVNCVTAASKRLLERDDLVQLRPYRELRRA